MNDCEPEVRDLFSSFGEDGSDFEHLVEVGGFRYHLLLQFNETERDCAENSALSKLYDSFDGDAEAKNEAMNECLGVLWPFLRSDYASRVGTTPGGIIKIQALTTNGVLHSQNHDQHLQYPRTNAIDNAFPSVTAYSSSEIKKLEELEMNIFKIELKGLIYCMKTVHRTGRESDFIHEVSTLQQCSHPNIVRLVGLEVNEEEKVEGMVIDYIENARSLRDISSISAELCDKWTGQIKHAIEYLHHKGLVWGDAKAANILIDEQDNAVLIDFGGGFTDGWVDMENHNTVRGDFQGTERIISFMRKKIE